MTGCSPGKRARGGQAIVELCAAMVVILMLLGALHVAVRMGRAHTRCAWEARASAGSDAIADSLLADVFPPHSPADTAPVSDLARWDELALDDTADPLTGNHIWMYALSHGRERAEADFSDVPFVGNFILGRDRAEIQADVYMVWTRGIY